MSKLMRAIVFPETVAPYTCPECGAMYPSGDTCQARFDSCLALEYESPAAYGAVHHLSVPCYMLQHNAYSREGWIETRELLRRFVRDELTPAAARQQNRKALDSGQRSWSFTRGPRLTQVAGIQWTCTIAGVRLDTDEHYVEDVRRWAERVLADTDGLAQTLNAARR